MQQVDKEIQQYLAMLGSEEKETILGVVKAFVRLKQEGGRRSTEAQYSREIDEAVRQNKATGYKDMEGLL
jgi:hypothetical protein